MNINKFWSGDTVVLDGAMGTELIKKGFSYESPLPLLNLTHKDVICDIHKQYIIAGADIIYTNTFGVSLGLAKGKIEFDLECVKKGIEIAKKAVEGTEVLVALNIGACGKAFSMGVEDMYKIFSEQAKLGEKHGADIIVLETFTDLMQLETALMAVRDSSSLPVIASMPFKEDCTAYDGSEICEVALTAMRHGISAFGINCVSADKIAPIVAQLKSGFMLPVFVKANAGPVKDEDGNYTHSIDREAFLEYMKQVKQLGVNIIGGCCGTDMEYIKEIKDHL